MDDNFFSKGVLEPEWGRKTEQITNEFWHGIEQRGPEPKFSQKD